VLIAHPRVPLVSATGSFAWAIKWLGIVEAIRARHFGARRKQCVDRYRSTDLDLAVRSISFAAMEHYRPALYHRCGGS